MYFLSYFFIYMLFNDTHGIWDCIVLNGKMVSISVVKDVEGSSHSII